MPLRSDGHGHVHGANLGIRSDLYRRVGGFPAVAVHEDVAVVEAALALDAPVAWPTDIAVITSARPGSRAPRGFSSYLLDLAADDGAAGPRAGRGAADSAQTPTASTSGAGVDVGGRSSHGRSAVSPAGHVRQA